jgi:hypothetical protein
MRPKLQLLIADLAPDRSELVGLGNVGIDEVLEERLCPGHVALGKVGVSVLHTAILKRRSNLKQRPPALRPTGAVV